MAGFFSRYGLAAHLALLAVAPLFLPPIACLWLTALAVLWLVLEPSRIGRESLHDAHARVRYRVGRDPLFWVLFSLVVVAALHALNTGVERSYDAEKGVWYLSPAACSFFLGCVEGSGLSLFSCAFAAWVVVTGCRHGLGRSARFGFLFMSSLFAALGILVWAILLKIGYPAAQEYFESAVTNPSFFGSACGIYLMFALMGLSAVFELSWISSFPLAMLAIAGNALGLFLFTPPVVALLFAGGAIILFMALFAQIKMRVGGQSEFKFLVAFSLSLVLVLAVMPRTGEALKLEPYLDAVPFFTSDYLSVRAILSGISWKAWLLHPWIGNGVGSFPLSLSFLATSTDWSVVSSCQVAPLNGYWMILAERGAIGAFLLVVPLALFLVTFVRRLIGSIRLGLPHPLILIGPLSLIAAGLEMAGDISFLSPGALIPLLAALSLAPHGFSKESSYGR